MVADGASVSFDRFMEWALYDPETGYYRQPPAAVLGKHGDFYTASQLQPVFGALIASLLPEHPVLELGAGRGEMRAALLPREYGSIGPGDELPASWSGTVFANEFFDALPVIAGVRRGNQFRELLVQRTGHTYRWTEGPELSAEHLLYVNRYLPNLPDDARFEIAERAGDWIRRIGRCLTAGTVLIIDYGWSAAEYLRFPDGTLMSYRRHAALENVLANPGSQDITAHVPFPVLIDAARESGFASIRFETLAQTLLPALERSPEFISDKRLAVQLKTLLFGMGESFRTLTLHKEATK